MLRDDIEKHIMSGILGMVNFDGRPVDAVLLKKLTRQLNRWASEQQHWIVLTA